jgi:cytochrome c oxidase subunit 2
LNRVRLPSPAGRRFLSIVLLASGLAVLVAGCNPYPQNVFELKTDYAIKLQDLFNIILVAAAVVFVGVEGALIFAAIRYKRRNDKLPVQFHGSKTLEILWTVAPTFVLAFVLWPSTMTIFETQAPAPEDSLEVRVIGHRFWWEFQYPSLGITTANEVHMPVERNASFVMYSADVIHSFWIPAMGGKRDVFPTNLDNPHYNYLWWKPNAGSEGIYPGQCAELCGESHANMRLRGIVDSQADFDTWVANELKPAVTPPADTPAAQGAQLFQQRGCAGCHTVSGTPAEGKVGPNLTHFGSRTTVAAGMYDATPENIDAWLANPPKMKPGSAMPNLGLNEADRASLVAYLQALK